MQRSDTVELVRQMRQALASMQSVQFSSQTVTQRQYEATKAGCEKAVAAADQWLAEQPTNQCGETCERAKMCATCARELSLPPQQQQPADPMDWLLPCDVKVGHGTHAKGTKLRSLVARMQALYDTVQASQAVAQPRLVLDDDRDDDEDDWTGSNLMGG